MSQWPLIQFHHVWTCRNARNSRFELQHQEKETERLDDLFEKAKEMNQDIMDLEETMEAQRKEMEARINELVITVDQRETTILDQNGQI